MNIRFLKYFRSSTDGDGVVIISGVSFLHRNSSFCVNITLRFVVVAGLSKDGVCLSF